MNDWLYPILHRPSIIRFLHLHLAAPALSLALALSLAAKELRAFTCSHGAAVP